MAVQRASAQQQAAKSYKAPAILAAAETPLTSAPDVIVRDGAPPKGPDPFKDPIVYVKAVETAEAALKAARKKLADAEAAKGGSDAAGRKAVADAQARRDQAHSQAIKAVDLAGKALEAKKAELQAPINETSGALANAKDALVDATYPDKKQLDAARANAHNEVNQMQAALDRAQSRLATIENQISSDQGNLGTQRNGMAQTRADLVITSARLADAGVNLQRAQYNAPSQYDWDRMQALLRDTVVGVRDAEGDVSSARDRVDTRRSQLNRLLSDGDRPTPPGGSDRPTPPSGSSDRPAPPSTSDRPVPPSTSGRPTPPSTSGRPTPPPVGGSDRPTPPSTSGDRPSAPPSAEIDKARANLAEAESILNRAERHLDDLTRQLSDIRRKHGIMSDKVEDVAQRQALVFALQTEISTTQTALSTYDSNIRTLQNRLNEFGQARPGAIQDRNNANADLGNSTQRARELDNRPYTNGDPAKIKSAQTKVDNLAAKLKGLEQAYADGVKPPTQKLSDEQATYNATMAPFNADLAGAQQRQSTTGTTAANAVRNAGVEVKNGEAEIANLKNVPGTTKFGWNVPKWLGGKGFNVDDFWKKRPAQ